MRAILAFQAHLDCIGLVSAAACCALYWQHHVIDTTACASPIDHPHVAIRGTPILSEAESH